MKASEIRAQAREDLSGKWGKVILLNVLFFVAVFVMSMINFIPVIGGIICVLLSVPLSYSYAENLMRLKRGETENVTELFTNIGNNFSRSWGVTFQTILKAIVPLIAIIVIAFIGIIFIAVNAVNGEAGGVVLVGLLMYIALIAVYIWFFCKVLLLVLGEYIAIDNPELSAKESVEKSMELMKGNRWKYIWLELSFIGWAILASLTFGIGYLWLVPYMAVSVICFYESLAGRKEKVVSTTEDKKVEEVVAEQAEPVVVAKDEEVKEEVVDEQQNPIKSE